MAPNGIRRRASITRYSINCWESRRALTRKSASGPRPSRSPGTNSAAPPPAPLPNYQSGYQDVESYQDEWGVTWQTIEYQTRFGKGKYTEPHGHPLADDRAIDTYSTPNPERPELYSEAERVIKEYKDEYWIVGVTPTTIFESAWGLRGYEQLMMDMAADPVKANLVLDFPYHYHRVVTQRLVKMGVDMIWLGDDVGGQHSMLMSPKMWRTYLKPRMAELIASLRLINPNIKIAYHTDGFVEPVIGAADGTS